MSSSPSRWTRRRARECTATVTVRLGNRRRARPTTTQTAWACEEESIVDEEFGDDEPVEEDEPVAEDELV